MNDFVWDNTNENLLFLSLMGHKPAGTNKHFEMACIWEKLQEQEVNVSIDKIWEHLGTMFNLESLDEIESTPFPNEEREFYLPEQEFGALKIRKEEKAEEKNGKSIPTKKIENNKTPNTKEVKKEEKPSGKKETPRRDSKDGKEAKLTVTLKKEMKNLLGDKLKPMKSRSSINVKDEEKPRTPSRLQEEVKRLNKRPLRGSTKPEEPTTPITRKSQSPLTVTPSNSLKRRRI